MAGGDFLGDVIGGIGSIIGGEISAGAAKDVAAENIAMQEEFAKNGIQWKVNDARAAGINPLAALGASTSSFSNVVGDQGAGGQGIAKAGQDLGRAVKSTMSADDQAFTDASHALQLTNQALNNDYLAARIRLMNQPGDGAPTPTPGQTYWGALDGQGKLVNPGTSAQNFPPVTGAVVTRPDKVTSSVDPANAISAGVHPDIQLQNTASGTLYPGIPPDMSAAMFNPYQQLAWSVRNQLAPWFGENVPAGLEDRSYDPFMGYGKKGSRVQAQPGSSRYYWDRNDWLGTHANW